MSRERVYLCQVEGCARVGLPHVFKTPTATLEADLCRVHAAPVVTLFASVGRSTAGGTLKGTAYLAAAHLPTRLPEHGDEPSGLDVPAPGDS